MQNPLENPLENPHDLEEEKEVCSICPPLHAKYLLTVSTLSLFSGIYAFAQGLTHLSIVPLGVWATSVNYWRNPMYGWRRNLDLTFVPVALTYQLYRSRNLPHFTDYCIMSGVACACYPVGWYLHNIGWVWAGIVAHSGIHVFGNIANILLYSKPQ